MILLHKNKGVAFVILSILLPIFLYITFSDWTYKKLTDGFYLGVFPAVYLLLSILLITCLIFDNKRDEILEKISNLSMRGFLKIFIIIAASLLLAFYEDSIGFLTCTTFLTIVCCYQMGVRNIKITLLYGAILSCVLYGVLSFIGFDFNAFPQF